MKKTQLLLVAAMICGGFGATTLTQTQLPVQAASTAATTGDTATVQTALAQTRAYEQAKFSALPAGQSFNTGYDWDALGLGRDNAASAANKTAYLADAAAALKASQGKMAGNLTEYSRAILAITAMGGDATDIGGYNLFAQLADLTAVTRQGINGAVYALLAVDANQKYSFPAGTTTKQALIDYILAKTCAEGGWTLFGSTADIDITAMALQALAPYAGQPAVKTQIDRAVALLSERQDDQGGYTAYGNPNVESVAQVLVALSTLGIDPLADNFVKNGASLLDNLESFHVAGSGFAHVKGQAVNAMATQQTYYALVAYQRYLNGAKPLYDMSDLNIAVSEEAPAPEPAPTPAPTPTGDATGSPQPEPTQPAAKPSAASSSDQGAQASDQPRQSKSDPAASHPAQAEAAANHQFPATGEQVSWAIVALGATVIGTSAVLYKKGSKHA